MRISAKELARLAGVKEPSVHGNKGLAKHRNAQGFDADAPEVKAYIEGKRKRSHSQRRSAAKSKASIKPDLPASQAESYLTEDEREYIDSISDPVARIAAKHEAEKLAWTRERRIKTELHNMNAKRDLLPAGMVRQWFGHFNAAIITNLLVLPGRIAKSDKALKKKIADELKRALDKTVADANRAIEADEN